MRYAFLIVFWSVLLNSFVLGQDRTNFAHVETGYGSSLISSSSDLILNPGPFVGIGAYPFTVKSYKIGLKVNYFFGATFQLIPTLAILKMEFEKWDFNAALGSCFVRSSGDLFDQKTTFKPREMIAFESARKLGDSPLYLQGQLSYFRFQLSYPNGQEHFSEKVHNFMFNLGLVLKV